MMAVIIGIVFIGLGGFGLLHWFRDFLTIVRGFGPVSILIGGVVALISGVASLRPGRSNDDNKR